MRIRTHNRLNSAYASITLARGAMQTIKNKLERAQFIELGETKKFHRCNLKFPQHQKLFVTYNKNSKRIEKNIEIMDILIKSLEELLELIKIFQYDIKIDFISNLGRSGRLWQIYKDTCKKFKLKPEPQILTDLNKIRFLMHAKATEHRQNI